MILTLSYNSGVHIVQGCLDSNSFDVATDKNLRPEIRAFQHLRHHVRLRSGIVIRCQFIAGMASCFLCRAAL